MSARANCRHVTTEPLGCDGKRFGGAKVLDLKSSPLIGSESLVSLWNFPPLPSIVSKRTPNVPGWDGGPTKTETPQNVDPNESGNLPVIFRDQK